MRYGTQIGRKFDAEGRPMSYAGNTVVSDAQAGSPAYQIMAQCLVWLKEAQIDELFIPLPEDSFHMTIIRGVNDGVRTRDYWPEALPDDAAMAQADAYMTKAVQSVANPGPLRMHFTRAIISDEDFRIGLEPADAAQAADIRHYRDLVADAVGLRLPGHDGYTYHITLAYTLKTPSQTQLDTINRLETRMNAWLWEQPEVVMDPPRMAYYRDMLFFYSHPLER